MKRSSVEAEKQQSELARFNPSSLQRIILQHRHDSVRLDRAELKSKDFGVENF